MDNNALGRIYTAGEVIFRQGELGDRMYVIQEGKVEIVLEQGGKEIVIAVRAPGDFFGEMALFEREVRMATARALGPARLLSVDQKNLLRRVHEDPSLAVRIIQAMSQRIRNLSGEVARLENWLVELGMSQHRESKG